MDKMKLAKLSDGHTPNGTEHPKAIRKQRKFDKFQRKVTIPHTDARPIKKSDLDPNHAFPSPLKAPTFLLSMPPFRPE